MADLARRSSQHVAPPTAATGTGIIPPPPPLPPSKASYFSRFVTQPLTTAYGSRPPSAQTNRPDGGRPNPLVPRLPGIRPGSSQDASHKTGLDISALDINRDRTHAILAGKEILKTVRVDNAKIVEETNLRAAVINYSEHHASAARQREGLGIHDVKWSHGAFSTHIATAAANGKIIVYDLNRAGVELARLHEHTRQVHKLAFNPHQGFLLLSASHDGSVRMWDLRDMRKDTLTCQSRSTFTGMNIGIRDVQWSPTDAVEFAFGTDNGTIQRWDFRYGKAAKKRITAHDQRICTSIDWHPDGKHILSAGVDRTVKVYDFYAEPRRPKPTFVLTTPYPVYNARWRPPYWSDEHFEKGAYQCTQLATSYDRDHPVMHVWDFRRPYLPFREINKFPSAPADMLWHSRDLLWTVGREGVFQQNDVHLAPKVVDRRNLQAFAVSPSGEIGGIAQKRPLRRRPGFDYSTDDTYSGDKRSSPEKRSLRSSADDSLDDSFLSSSYRRHHGRSASNRSTKSFGTTPPAQPPPSESAPKVMFLTDSVALHNDSLRPNQVAFRGALPGTINVQIFAYLAQKYKAIPLTDPPTLQSYLSVQNVFEQNAEYAQRAAFYRLAETWRIVGVSMAVAARRRATLHWRDRQQTAKLKSSNSQMQQASEPLTALDKGTSLPQNPAVRAILGPPDRPQLPHATHPVPANESTSNLATPLARPLTGPISTTSNTQQLHGLPNPDHEDEIQLPPAIAGPHALESLSSQPLDNASQSLRPENAYFNGPNWYSSPGDLDERRAMIGSWRAPPRAPLNLEPTNPQGINIKIPPRLDRHDSDESFAMFSASTDSQKGASIPSSYASGKSQAQPHAMEPISEKWDPSAGDSSFGKPRLSELRNGVAMRLGMADDLGKSVSISPKHVPIGTNDSRVVAPDDRIQQGSARDDADHGAEFSSREKAVRDIEALHKNNQLLRHDSSESEAFPSSSSELSVASFSHNVDMEASGTIVPDVFEDSAPPVLEPAAEEPLMLSDFQAMHVDAEAESAFSVIGLLKNVLAFHTNTLADAQTSAILLLLLAPILPQTQFLTGTLECDVAEALSAYSDTLTALGLSPTQTHTILSTQLTQLLATGVNPFQAEAILHTYHAQLHSLSLFNSAASLRRLAYPTYPAVYEQGLKDTQLGLLCLSCKSPINNPKDKMRCETCKRAQAPCPICWGRYPAFESVSATKKAKAKFRSSLKEKDHRRKRSSILSTVSGMDTKAGEDGPSPSAPARSTPPKATLWTWCPLCGHGGHTNCLSAWFASPSLSEGACATEGCLCDCVRGQRREDKIREMLEIKAAKEAAKEVRKGDDWKVTESKAVAAVRNTLGENPAAPRDSKEPPTQNVGAPGDQLGRREDGRRVRVVGPRDENRSQQQLSHAPASSQFLSNNPPAGKLPRY
ncbi:hypothetical protein K491DRAFT_659044 [Lophiostoma macrostomum CBS 122681]|uniref:Uncharacterized protein n=1 Tax=Lophiostoma macrostomum CBS 122681 TaxID=1314788 RepID=A0A6A6T8T6_9PLEO|nr:hypothetical protein K491DRAFT_659044 [Lophiostoma macrostomum CBS 122681]